MTDAPEKMVLQPCPMYGWDHPDRVVYPIGHARSYTRDDVKEAEKRAEYLRGIEDAADKVENMRLAERLHIAAAIRALAEKDG